MWLQNGNKYTTRLIITELKKSDRDQTGTVFVHNQRGGANYTYTLSNLEGEFNFDFVIPNTYIYKESHSGLKCEK